MKTIFDRGLSAWRKSGCHPPHEATELGRAHERAQELLAAAGGGVPILIRNEVDKGALYEAFDITRSNESPESARALLNLFKSVRWPDDSFEELKLLRSRAVALQAGTEDRKVLELRAACGRLDTEIDNDPLGVLDQATKLYLGTRQTSASSADRANQARLACLIGTALRLVGRYQDAMNWLLKARTIYRSVNDLAGRAAAAYQEIAVLTERRRFDLSNRLASAVRRIAEGNGLSEIELKCDYARAMSLVELGKRLEALHLFESVYVRARRLRSRKLIGPTLVVLVEVHQQLGDFRKAIILSRTALRQLSADKNQVALAKLHWNLALMLRKMNRPHEAVSAFRLAQRRLRNLGLFADFAAAKIGLASLFADLGRDQDAITELRPALPIIADLDLLPEAVAATTILRSALQRKRVDRTALETLSHSMKPIF